MRVAGLQRISRRAAPVDAAGRAGLSHRRGGTRTTVSACDGRVIAGVERQWLWRSFARRRKARREEDGAEPSVRDRRNNRARPVDGGAGFRSAPSVAQGYLSPTKPARNSTSPRGPARSCRIRPAASGSGTGSAPCRTGSIRPSAAGRRGVAAGRALDIGTGGHRRDHGPVGRLFAAASATPLSRRPHVALSRLDEMAPHRRPRRGPVPHDMACERMAVGQSVPLVRPRAGDAGHAARLCRAGRAGLRRNVSVLQSASGRRARGEILLARRPPADRGPRQGCPNACSTDGRASPRRSPRATSSARRAQPRAGCAGSVRHAPDGRRRLLVLAPSGSENFPSCASLSPTRPATWIHLDPATGEVLGHTNSSGRPTAGCSTRCTISIFGCCCVTGRYGISW